MTDQRNQDTTAEFCLHTAQVHLSMWYMCALPFSQAQKKTIKSGLLLCLVSYCDVQTLDRHNRRGWHVSGRIDVCIQIFRQIGNSNGQSEDTGCQSSCSYNISFFSRVSEPNRVESLARHFPVPLGDVGGIVSAEKDCNPPDHKTASHVVWTAQQSTDFESRVWTWHKTNPLIRSARRTNAGIYRHFRGAQQASDETVLSRRLTFWQPC